MNKRYTLGVFLLLLLAATNGYSQKPSFTQYFLNLPSVNPAFTGYEPYLDAKSAFRQRWSNFDDQNKSLYVSGYGAIGGTSPSVFKNNSLRISNPGVYDEMSDNRVLRHKHGVGGMVLAEKIGPFQSLSMNFNYAYHLPLSASLSMAMGVKVSYIGYKLDFQDYEVRDKANDLFYQQLMNSPEGKQQQFVGDFGITFYTKKFYIGFSSANLVTELKGKEQVLKLTPDKSYDMIVGTQLSLSPYLEFYPGARITYSDIYGTSWQANVRLRYDELIYAGVLYENDVKAALLFGLTFDRKYSINYSYDYYLNDLREFNTGNHEFTIGIAIFNKYSSESKLW